MKENFYEPNKPTMVPKYPKYDERSTWNIKPREWGSGIPSPIGHKGNPKKTVPAMPMKTGCYDV